MSGGASSNIARAISDLRGEIAQIAAVATALERVRLASGSAANEGAHTNRLAGGHAALLAEAAVLSKVSARIEAACSALDASLAEQATPNTQPATRVENVRAAEVAGLQTEIADLRQQLSGYQEKLRDLDEAMREDVERHAQLQAQTRSVAWLLRSMGKVLLSRLRPTRDVQRSTNVAGLPDDAELIVDAGVFDAAWYSSNYPDVAQSGIDALTHYLQFGSAEGRDPNDVFSTQWYQTQFEDVAVSRLNPLVHYLKYGMAQGRAPSSNFNPQWYLSKYPDIAATGIAPFIHYCRWGRAEGRQSGPHRSSAVGAMFFTVDRTHDLGAIQSDANPIQLADLLPSEARPQSVNSSSRVDVIVPVYGGYAETRRCIESVLRSIDHNTAFGRLIIVDDCGPDPMLRNYVASLSDDRVVILVNPKNLGFVRSVNRGMEFAAPNDVILLNSDTEVQGDWVDRLSAQALAAAEIGTVTPFSNAATICSFPDIGDGEPLPIGVTLEMLDKAAVAANNGRSADLPTAVGSCMYIKRECLVDVGLFDHDAWGSGYGEETDFSQNALKRGWRNVLAADVFVYHKGGVSFGTSSDGRRAQAQALMRARHPQFEPSVGEWLARDPALPMRVAMMAQLEGARDLPVVLHITHMFGGGTERQIADLAEPSADQSRHVILMLQKEHEKYRCVYLVRSDIPGAWRRFFFDAYEITELADWLRSWGVSRVHVHHSVDMQSELQVLLRRVGAPYDLSVHDYALICPRFNLARLNRYCGEPDESGCLRCLGASPEPRERDIVWWREQGRVLIEGADRVVCPTADVADRVAAYFPRAKVVAAPHEHDLYRRPRNSLRDTRLAEGERLRVAVLGVQAGHKGGEFLLDCVDAARAMDAPLEWSVIGEFQAPLDARARKTESLVVTGAYAPSDLARMIKDVDPHLVFFPQHIPETYSFTLSEAFSAGRPVLVPSLGSFPERVAGSEASWLYDIEAPPEAVVQLLVRLRQAALSNGNWSFLEGPSPTPRRTPVHLDFYEREYIASEDVREQLAR